MTDEAFTKVVQDTLDSLPEEFRTQLDNVEIVIEDAPVNRGIFKKLASSRQLLLGLYHGVPKTKRFGRFMLPDKITIYKTPLLLLSGNDNEAEQNIRNTLLHEIGHHFGLSDKRLKELGR